MNLVRAVCVGCVAAAGLRTSRVIAQPIQPETITLAGDLSLARLLDLCAQRLEINLDYDAQALKSTATIRLGQQTSDAELWELANRVLASRGFAIVRPPGSDSMSVVRLQDAAAASGILTLEEFGVLTTPSGTGATAPILPGFMSVLIARAPSPAGLETLRQVLGKPGGAMTSLGGGAIVLSDTRPRLTQAIALLESLEGRTTRSTSIRAEVHHVPAPRLVELARRLSAAATPRAPLGDLFVSADDQAVMIVAPAHDVPVWREIIESLDVPGDVERRTYVPSHHAVADVSALMGQLLPPGEPHRMVTDPLTGSIIVTSTSSTHHAVADLLERLEAMPPSARRPVRSFTLRNRPVQEVGAVLGGLIASGTFDAIPSEPPAAAAGDAPADQRPAAPEGLIAPGVSAGRSAAQRSISITTDEATNTLIVVAEPLVLDRIASLIEDLDVRQAQVQIEVLLVSLTEGQTRDLGVEIDALIRSGNLRTRLASLFGLSSGGADPERSVGDPAGLTGLVLSPGEFTIVVRALETLNEGRSLSVPTILVMNNQQGTLDAVLQQPFISVNASDTVATTSFGGTSDAGTNVTVRPQISEGDHLLLEYSISLSAFVGEASDPSIPPPRQQTRMQSVATIPDGFAIALGGIEVVSDGDAQSRIPILGSVPIIKEAFRSRSRNESRSRFFVFLRATILRDRRFEDLKHLSELASDSMSIDDGWPRVQPRIIR